jgi:hypothetical protein
MVVEDKESQTIFGVSKRTKSTRSHDDFGLWTNLEIFSLCRYRDCTILQVQVATLWRNSTGTTTQQRQRRQCPWRVMNGGSRRICVTSNRCVFSLLFFWFTNWFLITRLCLQERNHNDEKCPPLPPHTDTGTTLQERPPTPYEDERGSFRASGKQVLFYSCCSFLMVYFIWN